MVGMIVGITCGLASAAVSIGTMAGQGIAAKAQNQIMSQSGADAAKMHSTMLQNTDTVDHANAQLTQTTSKVGPQVATEVTNDFATQMVDDQAGDLQTNFENAVRGLNDAKTDLATKTTNVNAAKETLQVMEGEKINAQSAYDAKSAAVDQKQQALETAKANEAKQNNFFGRNEGTKAVEQAQRELDTAKADYEDVTAQLEQARDEARQLTDEVESGKATAEQLQGDLDAANARVTELEGAAAEAEAKIADLETAATEAAERIGAMEEEIGAKDVAIGKLVGSVGEKNQAIGTMKAAADEAEAKIAQLESAVAEKDEALNTIAATIDSLNAAISGGEADAEEVAEEVAEAGAAATEALEAVAGEEAVAGDDAVVEGDAETEAVAGGEASAEAVAESEANAEADLTATDTLSDTMGKLEQAVVAIAGLQAQAEDVPEAVAAVDLEDVESRIAAVMEQTGDEVTEETRVDALNEILEELQETLPEEIVEAVNEEVAEAVNEEVAEAAEMEVVQAQLDAAQAQVEQLSGALADKLEDIDALNEAISALDAQAETDAAQLETLQAQLTQAEADAKAQGEALAAAQADYEKKLAEVEAYKLDHAPASGEAHLSTAVDNAIEVAADGVTATWQYANSDLSGNAAMIELVLDGEKLYSSGPLKPGETIEGIVLDKPLAPGSYEATVVTTVYDADGAQQFSSRVPVTVNVAG